MSSRTRRRGLAVPVLLLLSVTACAGDARPLAVRPSHRATSSPQRAVQPGTARTSTGRAGPAGGPLAGRVIGVDPGHNGHNYLHPTYINRLIFNGREWEHCNTTGTATNAGYSEAAFTFHVARYLAADLRRAGARVVMTRRTNTGVGPCVDKRAAIVDAARPVVSISIHGDGGPSDGRGFTVLEPVRDGYNGHVRGSRRFGTIVRNTFRRTGMPTSTYDGVHGIKLRDDLAGLNLIRVPNVLLECGNMRNAADARLMTSSSWQRNAARILTRAIVAFVTRRR